jgi:hypothetical protein
MVGVVTSLVFKNMQWVLSVDIITAIIAVGSILPLAISQPPRIEATAKL